MPTTPWWRNTTEAPLAEPLDFDGLGDRELLQRALSSEGCLRVKTYNGNTERQKIEPFLQQLTEKLRAPVVLRGESKGSTVIFLISDCNVVQVKTASNSDVEIVLKTLREEDVQVADELFAELLFGKPV